MRSAVPKVLHEIAGRPMIAHVLAALAPLAPAATVVVVGQDSGTVAKAVAPAETVVQHPPRGTGDAVRAARTALEPALAGLGDVMVLYGDAPLLQSETIARLIETRRSAKAAVAVAGMRPADPGAYGRLVLGRDGGVERIVEAKDATPDEARDHAVQWRRHGDRRRAFVRPARPARQQQRQARILPDRHRRHRLRPRPCVAYVEVPAEEVIGVNTRAELAEAEALMQQRLRRRAMDAGATLIAPETVFLSADTGSAAMSSSSPMSSSAPGSRSATTCESARSRISTARQSDEGAIVGPFARLRPGAVLERDVHVGNFVEVKTTRLGAGAKANHLSYLGDAISARAPISAPARSPAITTASTSTAP